MIKTTCYLKLHTFTPKSEILKTLDPKALIHTEIAQVKGYDVGQDLNMHPGSLIRCMHDTAIEQIVKLKLSAKELKPLHLGWVLVHQDLHIIKLPTLGEKISITTHPSGKDRLYTYRDYLVKNETGSMIATASTAWILMDILNRKRSVYPPFIEEILLKSNQLPALERPHLQKERNIVFNNANHHIPQYSEIDFNGHLSNHYFFKWMLDDLPSKFLQSHQVQRINVKFRGEAFEGDHLKVRSSSIDSHKIHHQITTGNILLVHGFSEWATSNT